MISSLHNIENIFFIGIAGSGMSAIAQFLAGTEKNISGSDRFFVAGQTNDTQEKLEALGVHCFAQDGTGINNSTQLIVASSAVEDTNIEIQKARELAIPVLLRSQLLTIISNTKRTIAIGGTSGKSTTAAMLFDILESSGLAPSIISGAGLVRLQKQGLIGNAYVGKGEWLVIEADESDGSIINYFPEIGVLLNIDKDHKEIGELNRIFAVFKEHTKRLFIVNAGQPLAAAFSQNSSQDFTSNETEAGYRSTDFRQEGFLVRFKVNGTEFMLNAPGRHNMENALAAICAAHQIGVSLETCAAALTQYEGIYRRNQVLGQKDGVWVVDDYAHNPAKLAAAIRSVQPIATKVVAWFQPHGYGPTRFLQQDFVEEISKALRPQDEIWMSEIFYAGGTTEKDISANDLISGLKAKGSNAFFVNDRQDLVANVASHLEPGSVLLLMGARDPGLGKFSRKVFDELQINRNK